MTPQELHLAAAKAIGLDTDEVGFLRTAPWLGWLGSTERVPLKEFTIRDVGPIIERYGMWPTFHHSHWDVTSECDDHDDYGTGPDLTTAVLTLVVKQAEAGKLKAVKP